MDIAPEDILVTIAHPFGDVETTLAVWMARGPGPRLLVRAINLREKATGQSLSEEVIPLVYRNTFESRKLIRSGLLPNPYPPEELV